jgi:hypothetical protein
MAVLQLDKRSHAWSFAITLDMAVYDASQGTNCCSSCGIVNSTEIFSNVLLSREAYQCSSLKTVDIASSSLPRDILSGTNLLPVKGFIHAHYAVLKTSLVACLEIPCLDVTWTKIVRLF